LIEREDDMDDDLFKDIILPEVHEEDIVQRHTVRCRWAPTPWPVSEYERRLGRTVEVIELKWPEF